MSVQTVPVGDDFQAAWPLWRANFSLWDNTRTLGVVWMEDAGDAGDAFLATGPGGVQARFTFQFTGNVQRLFDAAAQAVHQ